MNHFGHISARFTGLLQAAINSLHLVEVKECSNERMQRRHFTSLPHKLCRKSIDTMYWITINITVDKQTWKAIEYSCLLQKNRCSTLDLCSATFRWTETYWSLIHKQESIPVGCIPTAFVVPNDMMSLPVWSHVLSGGVWSQGGRSGLVPEEIWHHPLCKE